MQIARLFVGPACAVLFLAPAVRGQVLFVDTSESSGLRAYHMAAGMASAAVAEDYDGDGDIDVFVPTGLGYANQLYVNQGNGVFVDSAVAKGLGATENYRGALWFDYDGDHDLDLLVVSDNFRLFSGYTMETFRLYRQNADGSFTERSGDAGLGGLLYPISYASVTHVGGVSAADLNGDGWVDLLVSFWQPNSLGASIHVYFNDGDGTFSDWTLSSGMNPVGRSHWQPVIHDFNRDGLLDVFEAIDYQENRLWINQGGGLFANIAPQASVNNAWNDMGVSLGDYDNDGDFDMIVTNIQADEGSGSGYDGRHNVLYRNQSVGSLVGFSEVAEECRVDDGDWGWGVTFFDANCDGWLDIAQTNGFQDEGYLEDPSRLFLSTGGAPVDFDDISASSGVSDTDVASCMIAFDADRDGDLDLFQTTGLLTGQGGAEAIGLRLYENVTLPAAGSAGASYLVVRPRMPGTDWFAPGTEVRVRTGAAWRARLITAGTSMLGQEPSEAHFGLGDATYVDEIRVRWPDGYESVYGGVCVNQIVDIERRCRADLLDDGGTDVFDFNAFASNFGSSGLTAFTGGDLDGDGDVDAFDFNIFALDFGCP